MADEFWGRAAHAFEIWCLVKVIESMMGADGDSTYMDAAAWVAAGMGLIGRGSNAFMSGAGKEAASEIREASKEADERAKKFYGFRGREPQTVKTNEILKTVERRGASRVGKSISDCLRTSAWAIYDNEGRLVPFRQGYLSWCQDVVSKVPAMGTQEALAECVNSFARSGLRVVYPSGRTRELWSAMEMNVRDALRKQSNDYNLAQGELFGADGVEVTAHYMCAADHLPYQGREFSKAMFEQIQGSLDRPIAEGMNCRHSVYPCILGAGTTYDREKLKEFEESSTRMTGFKLKSGRELNAYEFTQWQRQQENDVRRIKGAMSLMRAGGQSTERLQRALDAKMDRYAEASKQTGIRTRYDRMAAYTFNP
mgnify:FL=1